MHPLLILAVGSGSMIGTWMNDTGLRKNDRPDGGRGPQDLDTPDRRHGLGRAGHIAGSGDSPADELGNMEPSTERYRNDNVVVRDV